MNCVCKFNPLKDIKETVPGQSIEIFESISTGVVPPASKESFSNALDDIKKVGNRVRDVFDAIEASGIIASSIKESTAESGKTD